MKRDNWTFAQYMEEIFMISEIIEIPGMKQKRTELLTEVLDKFPTDCEELGIRK